MTDRTLSPADSDAPPPVRRHAYTWLIPLATVIAVVVTVIVGLRMQASDMPPPGQSPPPPDRLPPAERIYAENCASCHGHDGSGVGRFPPLQGIDTVVGEPHRLILVTLHGLTGPVSIDDRVYNDVMPGFEHELSDVEIALLLTYLRSTWGHDVSPITAEQVGELRREHTDRRRPWTDAELKQ